MDLFKFFIKYLSNQLKLKNLPARWEAFKNLGMSKKLDIPNELIGLNIDLLTRAFYNINAIQPNSDWIWPYWVNKQYNPEDISFLPSSYLSINLTHRNWTAISSLNSDFEAIIDEKALLTPLFDGWSIEYWIKKEDYIIIPSKNPKINQHLVNRAPILKSVFYKKGLQITSEVLMHEIKKSRFVVADYLIDLVESGSAEICLYISIRPYNPESIIPIFSIEYLRNKNAFIINNKDFIYLQNKPNRVICSNQANGDSYTYCLKDKNKNIYKIKGKEGLCTAFAEYRVKITDLNSYSTKIIIPIDQESPKDIREILQSRYRDLKYQNINLWDNKKKDAMIIQTPDSKINRAFEYSKTNLLTLLDKDDIPPGPFTYHKMWFRDAAYSITALLKMGFVDDVGRIIKNYFKKLQKDGYFLSQNGEWDSNGQALWTISQYYFFTKDTEFIQKNYSLLLKAVNWVFNQIKTTMKNARDLHYGLLPAGFSAEHFGPSNYYYWDNFWAYAGIRDFLKIAKILKYNVNTLEKQNEKFLQNIKKSIARFQKYANEKYIPSSPYRKKDSSIIGSVSALYPLQIFAPHQDDITNTLKIIRKEYMQKGAFFHKLMHSGYNVYLTAQVAECYLMQKSTLAIPVLHWILDHATDTFTFPEAIHPETGGGCVGDGHHGWATSELIHLIRNMIFYEKENELIFFSTIPHHWLDKGHKLNVQNAHTHFGVFNIMLESSMDYIEFRMQGIPSALKPFNVQINLPYCIEFVEDAGKEIKVENKVFIMKYKEELNLKLYIKE